MLQVRPISERVMTRRSTHRGGRPRVENTALRERVELIVNRGEVTYSFIARELGWQISGPHHPNHNGWDTFDIVRLGRRLGRLRQPEGNGIARYSQYIDIELAARIAEICNIDPRDIGI